MSKAKILIIYTGGTFGMSLDHSRRGDRLSVPDLSPQILKKNFSRRVPELEQIAHCDVDVLMNCDSAHIGPQDWCKIAQKIRTSWKKYDGIVVLHGTDTLAYTASALSFLLKPCLKPVILTGAQRPLTALRSDARRNLVSAVEIASSGPGFIANRVSVFFDDKLFQGNRVHKQSATEYHAFESPHAEPLAVVGTEIRYHHPERPSRKKVRKPVHLAPCFNSKVALIHVTPGFPAEIFSKHLLPQLEGIVLNVFPSGTAPTHDEKFLEMLRTARKRSIPVVVVTEAGVRVNPAAYEAGRALMAEGCTWAGDLTTECSFVKTALILGQKEGKKRFSQLWDMQFADEG
ncbi:MAG TPA: hypothetical protein DCS07_00390 [Bdellovibrionales bacterium]|nr:MAG: hypothetical protein A2X97_06320 [Bdellovibrionales bacterium GWA1_52_35]OFZ42920.1 MAG: hypothetical protein A2070_04635 [Bdellovibrionales bacterium GWC1_52_8]HAR41088.1 hypothetical protein [Bdellovibrionales bacterium]HCM40895.1 hypothetical protein [Bdellovibrionales bacterium]